MKKITFSVPDHLSERYKYRISQLIKCWRGIDEKDDTPIKVSLLKSMNYEVSEKTLAETEIRIENGKPVLYWAKTCPYSGDKMNLKVK